MSGRNSFWRDAGRVLRIAGIDARAFFPLVLALFHMRIWTFGIAAAAIAVFKVLETKGYTLPVFLRAVRHWLRGRVVVARAWWYQRRFFD